MRLLLLLLTAQLLSAADIVVSQAWSRATSPSMPNGAVFLTIANRGAVDDTLLAVSSAAAERVELHTVVTEGEKKRMVPVDGVPVAAKGATMLKPGSYHIMLFGLKQPLVEGQTIALSLTFAHAGAVQSTARISGAAAMASPDAGDDDDCSCCQPK